MELNREWLEAVGLDTESGLSFTGKEEKLLSAVQRFHGNYEKNRAKVEETLASGDTYNLMITVHALKSNAKMIGASMLSKGFEELETAARNGDEDTLRDKTPEVLKAYGDLIEKLSPIGEAGPLKASDEIGAEEARRIAGELTETLDDFNDDLSKKLIRRLKGYPFRATQAEMLGKAYAFADDFMYDEALEIIKELIPFIE